VMGVLDGRPTAWLAKWTAFFIATGVTTLLNFIGMRQFTFRRGISERMVASIADAAVSSGDVPMAKGRAGAAHGAARAA
jgi:hypothetical protein